VADNVTGSVTVISIEMLWRKFKTL